MRFVSIVFGKLLGNFIFLFSAKCGLVFCLFFAGYLIWKKEPIGIKIDVHYFWGVILAILLAYLIISPGYLLTSLLENYISSKLRISALEKEKVDLEIKMKDFHTKTQELITNYQTFYEKTNFMISKQIVEVSQLKNAIESSKSKLEVIPVTKLASPIKNDFIKAKDAVDALIARAGSIQHDMVAQRLFLRKIYMSKPEVTPTPKTSLPQQVTPPKPEPETRLETRQPPKLERKLEPDVRSDTPQPKDLPYKLESSKESHHPNATGDPPAVSDSKK